MPAGWRWSEQRRRLVTQSALDSRNWPHAGGNLQLISRSPDGAAAVGASSTAPCRRCCRRCACCCALVGLVHGNGRQFKLPLLLLLCSRAV